MTPEARVAGAMKALKVFPLPSAVLFPGTALPLHIFEPRYRAMVSDALRTDGVIALADLEPGWEPAYAGRPPLKPIACAGVIAWNEQLPDGRYDLVLQGVQRVRVLEELPDLHLYREVRAQLVEDPPYEGPLEELVQRALLELAGHLENGVAENLMQLAARARGGALADLVAAALVSDVERRRVLRDELSPARRLQRVLDEVGELIARIGAAHPPRGPMN